MPAHMTLAEKLYDVLLEERTSNAGHPLNVSHAFPFTAGEVLSEFELDCHDWGFVFGLAYGLARSEDPDGPEADVSSRALSAAREAFTKWGGDDIFTATAFAQDRAARLRVLGAVA
jgi:hypothetical protein